MQRKRIAFVFLTMSSVLLALTTNTFTKFRLVVDFREDGVSQSLETEFGLNGSTIGKEFDLSFSLQGTRLSSSKVGFKLGELALDFYKNQRFGTSNDPLVLYKVDGGHDGLSVKIGTFSAHLFNTLPLMFLSFEYPLGVLLLGKRNENFDVAGSFGLELSGVRFIGEVAWQDFTAFDVNNTVYLLMLTEGGLTWGVRYVVTPLKTLSLAYSPQSLGINNILTAWYKFQVLDARFNTYVNSKFNFDAVISEMIKNSELGIDVSLGELGLWAKKRGLDSVTGVMPNEWGDFSIGLSYGFPLFDGKARVVYSFGKPAHGTVSTLGEVFYGEFARSFGNVHVFGKYQKIIGYYEERETAYGEVKFTGFGNAEVKVWIGNGDFNTANTFRPITGIEFNLWW